MFFRSLIVATAIIALCSGSTCNVYRAIEEEMAVPQSYVCCNNTEAANSGCNMKVYSGTDENKFHCSADGIGKEQKYHVSFECGSCLKQQKCDEFSQNLEHSSRNRVKVFKTCCASYVVEEETFSIVRRDSEANMAYCGDGICDEDETPCNCTADCDDRKKTTKCTTDGGSIESDRESVEIIIGLSFGLLILTIGCCSGLVAIIGLCIRYKLAKSKEQA